MNEDKRNTAALENIAKTTNIIANHISKDPFSKESLRNKGLTIHISLMEVEPMKKVLSIIKDMLDDPAVPIGYIERLCVAINLTKEEDSICQQEVNDSAPTQDALS